MRFSLAFSMCMAATLGSVTPALAITSSGPVRVVSCTVWSRNAPHDILTPNVDLTNGVTVMLVNDSNKTTSSVTVTGSYHGRVVTDSAKVMLKPGASVTFQRSYYPPSTYIDPTAQCRVTKVSFTDGTSWSSP